MSNITGRWITPDEAMNPHYWARHARETVRFADSLGEILKDPQRVLLEVGPGRTLTTFAMQHPDKTAERLVLSSIVPVPEADTAALLDSLGRLWLAGKAINWRGFYAHEQRLRVPLPTYPFQRQRYWIEGRPKAPVAAPGDRFIRGSHRDRNGRAAGGAARASRRAERLRAAERPRWKKRWRKSGRRFSACRRSAWMIAILTWAAIRCLPFRSSPRSIRRLAANFRSRPSSRIRPSGNWRRWWRSLRPNQPSAQASGSAGAASPGRTSITFQSKGDRPPFFFLHGDWAGGGFYCGHLMERLGDNQPFYTLPPYRSGRKDMLPFQELIDKYYAVLRAHTPRGPYIMGGYCIGGTIALGGGAALRGGRR